MSTTREQKHSVICHNCKSSFRAARNDAKFCSQKCRRDVMIKRRRMLDFYSQLVTYLDSLEKVVEDPELGPDAFNLLERIEGRVCKAVKRASKTDMAKGLAMQA